MAGVCPCPIRRLGIPARCSHWRDLTGIAFFSAEENFFQLPAVLSLCQLIISVLTTRFRQNLHRHGFGGIRRAFCAFAGIMRLFDPLTKESAWHA